MDPTTVSPHAVTVARPLPACTVPAFALAIALTVPGCANIKPYIPPSEGHIAKPQVKAEPDKAIPPPARVSELVPPPKPVARPQTYSVVVSEVSVKDLLVALARDTRQNIDVHPGISGLVSLNAVNETLPAILERVSKQVNLRYRLEGNTIVVSPDVPYVKTYRIGYVDMKRDTSSTVGVSGQIAATGTQATGAASASSTVVTTTMASDFYQTLRDNLKGILSTMRAQGLSAEGRRQRQEEQKAAVELERQRLSTASAAANAAVRSGVIMGSGAVTDMMRATQGGGVTVSRVEDDIIVNSQSGTVTVSASEREHQAIQHHIDSILTTVQRQVLIEATIVEVVLSDKYQGGVDWSRLPISGGPTLIQRTLGGFGTGLSQAGANFFQIGYLNTTTNVGNISATVKLLEEFGNTRVLSSPKLMALNNQTALLKVVDNVVYFEVQATTTQTQTTSQTSFSTSAKTVAVGVVMTVTSQINEDGRVSLTVRPTISRILRFVNDPNPSLANPCGVPVPVGGCSVPAITNAVPEIQTREMESVLQVGSGQTVVLGGLMQDNVQRDRQQIPGADQLSAAGELLRFRDERVSKSELMIFLRPTVVANPSLESDELRFFQRFLPQPESAPAKTGAAQ